MRRTARTGCPGLHRPLWPRERSAPDTAGGVRGPGHAGMVSRCVAQRVARQVHPKPVDSMTIALEAKHTSSASPWLRCHTLAAEGYVHTRTAALSARIGAARVTKTLTLKVG